MMETEIRPLEIGDSLRHRELMNHAFGKGSVVAPSAEEPPPPGAIGAYPYIANTWGLFVGGELQAALGIVPFETQWGRQTVLKLGGIAGVATWAHARGNGYVAELLTESLRIMRDRGEVVSALGPFSYGFYRAFGWDWVGEKRTLTLPLQELRACPEGKFVRDVTERGGDTVRPKLQAAYTNYARNYRGIFTEDTHKWDAALEHAGGRTTYVYQYEPTGEYLLWRYEQSDKGRIMEWTARTPDGFRAHLSLLHYLGTQCKTAQVSVPGDCFLPAHFMHRDMEAKTAPVFMGRVVDFGEAMRRLPPLPDVSNAALTLFLSDKHAPWNDGLWRVGVEDGAIFCENDKAAGADADIILDIQTLSQAFWGSPPLEWLRNAGRIQRVANEAAFALLFRLLPAHPVYSLDSF